jgi:hypothetical protein
LNGEHEPPMTATLAKGLGTVVRPLICAGAASMAVACVSAPKPGPVSTRAVQANPEVVADLAAAVHSPGPYPTFRQIPAMPTDVRPVTAWRTAVITEWSVKRRTEREAAAIPFVLADTEAWAARERAKIPASENEPPAADAAAQIEAFAAAERERATPPPPPK